jgi:glyoxylase-like metal-dependent hydrolase (beta-lactamase superfamily II)
MLVTVVPVGALQCNCTILGDPESGEAIVVDPGDEVEKVLAALRRHGLRCTAILNTHAHIDHVGANQPLKEATRAPVMLHAADLPLYDNGRRSRTWPTASGSWPAR